MVYPSLKHEREMHDVSGYNYALLLARGDVIEEQGAGGGVEGAEVGGALRVGGRRAKELVLGVAPNQGVRQGVVAQDRQQYPIPPAGVRYIGKATLGESYQFVVLRCEMTQHIQVSTRLTDKIFLRAPLVGIEADEVNALVTGIPPEELLLRHIAVQVWRITPNNGREETISIRSEGFYLSGHKL